MQPILRIPTFRKRVRTRPQPGASPGTLAISSELPGLTIQVREFNKTTCHEREGVCLSEIEGLLREPRNTILWLEVQGLGDADALRQLGNVLCLHALTVEDIAHVYQHPKVEEIDDYLFAVLRMFRPRSNGVIENEQLSLVLKKGLVVTFQEKPGDVFQPVLRRLRDEKSVLRRSETDYLAYALIDAVFDSYFPVIDLFEDTMDRLDEEVMSNPTSGTVGMIYQIRREVRQFRRSIWPLRDVAATLSRVEIPLVSRSVRLAFRDCHDHIIQVAELTENHRERASDLVDAYLSFVSNHTNEVMKVLTIIATIFIPLTFLCGIYGMNFDTGVSAFNMPELKWRYGYVACWAVMVIMVLIMMIFFYRRGWLGEGKEKNEGVSRS